MNMKLMKKFILLCCLLTASVQLSAIPARPNKTTITMADGTQQVVSLRGDESYHFYVTEDGRPVVVQADGRYVYSTPEAVSEIWTERFTALNAHRMERGMARFEARQRAKTIHKEFGVPSVIEGEKRGLVILVNFADKKMSHTQEEIDAMFNQEGYSENGHIGSVRDYFAAQSYGKLTIDFDVVGPYTVSQKMAYYGANDSNGSDKAPEKMIEEACRLAKDDVNYPDYDWDGDGEVDQVYVIYAGYGEASGAPSNTIWPHEFHLTYAGVTLRLDGVKIDTYACGNELSGVSGTTLEGIGTPCHEFSHCLGLPDFYDTGYQNFGMGYWSVMDAGCNLQSGNVPLGYNAYERWFSGWLDPVELKDGCTVTEMPSLNDEPVAYIIYNEANRNEYYILQNIQQTGWFRSALGHGLLVQHVDYNKNTWQSNGVNSVKSRQRCTIIPADNRLAQHSYDGQYFADPDDHVGDPYPGSTYNRSLTDTSTPAATLYNANADGRKYMGKPIEDIRERKQTVSFVFNGGISLSAPEVLAPTDMGKDGFTANWTAVEDAVSYTVELTEVDPNAQLRLMLAEDFSGFADKVNASVEWSGSLDQVLSAKGWTGEKVYSGKEQGAKLGTSKLAGVIATPLLDAPASGIVSILFAGSQYGSDSYGFKVTVEDADGNEINSETFNVAGTNLMTVSNVDKAFRVRFTSTPKRAYLKLVKVVDGEATANEIAELDAEAKARAPRRLEKRSVEGITVTSYRFTELTGHYYTFRVKAVGETIESSWSDEFSIDLSSFDSAIRSVSLDEIGESEIVSVFSASGQFVKQTTRGHWADTLPRGTYILKAGEKVVKAVRK